MTLYFNKLESPIPDYILCQVLLREVLEKMKMWKVYDTNMSDNGQILIKKLHLSLELKQSKSEDCSFAESSSIFTQIKMPKVLFATKLYPYVKSIQVMYIKMRDLIFFYCRFLILWKFLILQFNILHQIMIVRI